MLSDFEARIGEFVGSLGVFASGGRYVLAVSGGADSTALAYALAALKEEGLVGGEFVCGHVNHGLRGAESSGDERFVSERARELGLDAVTRCVDVRGHAAEQKLSIETAGRMLRIEALIDIAKETSCGGVVTAHHRDDNAETVVQRLVRGTGFRGLAGIWPVRKIEGVEFVRPLLCVGRAEIVEYLTEKGLEWRTDLTNADCSFRRNFIRHKLLPELQSGCEREVPGMLWDLSQAARLYYDRICGRVDEIWDEIVEYDVGNIHISADGLAGEHPEVQVEVLRRCLGSLGSGEGEMTQRHYERILDMVAEDVSGGVVELPGGYSVRREGERLILLAGGAPVQVEVSDKMACLKVPGKQAFAEYLIETEMFEAGDKGLEEFREGKDEFVEWFDFDKIRLPLIVRTRQAGDRFWPLGLEVEKTVGKFLTAAKIDRENRKRILVVADTERIIWVWPVRISEHVKVTSKTWKVLQLRIRYSEASLL